MTVMLDTPTSDADQTGPKPEEVLHGWPRDRGRSSSEGAVGIEDLKRGEQLRAKLQSRIGEKTVLLGILMSRLEGLELEEVGALLDIRPEKLVRLLHGENLVEIGGAKEQKWQDLALTLHYLHGVLKPRATGTWFRTPIPDLDGQTPLAAANRGQHRRVLEVARSYEDPGFF